MNSRVQRQYEEYIYLSKYARWLEDKGRRETWEETVDRLIDFLCNHIENKLPNGFTKITDVLLGEIREAILTKKIMPSMRLMMTAGRAAERCNSVAYNCAGVAIDNPRVFDEIFYILMGGSGVGFSVERQYINQMPKIASTLYPTDTTIVVQDSRTGWAKALKELITLLYNGDVPKWDVSKVRKAGTRLKTMGGRASGPEPLVKLFKYCILLFTKARGRKLRSVECHDLICTIADTVIVGSVRRSACISFSNLTDLRMSRAKGGQWWIENPERALANNSIMFTEKPDLESYTKEWRSIYKSRSGERGFVNQEALKDKVGDSDYDGQYLLNPCMTGDTRLLTSDGYVAIKYLVGNKVSVWNGERWSNVSPFSTGTNPILKVTLSNGAELKCTPYHKFILKDSERVEAKDLLIGDKLEKFPMPIVSGEELTIVDPYSQGFYSGDGNKHSLNSHLYFTKFCCQDRLTGSFSKGDDVRKNWNHGQMLPKEFVPTDAALRSKIDWLAGLLDADGYVLREPNSSALCLTSIDKTFLNEVRVMLSTLGVNAKVCNEHKARIKEMPDGKGGYKSYNCQTSYRLLINAMDTSKLKSLGIYFSRLQIGKCTPNRNASRFVTVVSVEDLGYKEETFCATERYNNSLCFEGIVTGNCGEAILRDTGGFCNLTEVIIRGDDTLEDLKDKVDLATILGTIQATLTNFKYLRKIWTSNSEEERLLGVSLTGIMDHKVLSDSTNCAPWVIQLKRVSTRTNGEFAKLLGIPPSRQCTLIKPSGTVSQLVGCSSGIHPRYSKYYKRTIAQDIKDPLSQLMIDEGIPYNEVGEKYYFYFPIESPDNSILQKDIDAIQQLELWKVYREHWCDGNPSQTIYYTDDTFLAVQDWVWKNWDIIGGLSFFPISDHIYENAPYESIDEEEYKRLVSSFPPSINWSLLSKYEQGEDSTSSGQEFACSGGSCEI